MKNKRLKDSIFCISNLEKILKNEINSNLYFFNNFIALSSVISYNKISYHFLHVLSMNNDSIVKDNLFKDDTQSRQVLFSNFKEELEKHFLLISNLLQVEISLKDADELLIQYLLFLESTNFIKTESKIKSSNNKLVFRIKYFLEKEKDSFTFHTFLNEINLGFHKTEIILFKNNYFLSENIKIYSLFSLGDNLFCPLFILKRNNLYGYTIDKDSITQRASTNDLFKTKDNVDFIKSIDNENKQKRYFDRLKFLNIVDDFLKVELKSINLDLNSSFDDFFKILNLYSDVSSPTNKNLLYNVLILYNLKILIEKFKDQDYCYFSCSFDFRGRKYYDSMISVTN